MCVTTGPGHTDQHTAVVIISVRIVPTGTDTGTAGDDDAAWRCRHYYSFLTAAADCCLNSTVITAARHNTHSLPAVNNAL